MLNLPVPVISRYVKGHILPNLAKSEKIISFFKTKYLADIVKSKLKIKEGNILDLTPVVYDIGLQRLIGKFVFHEFNLLEVDKILTVETDGIPLAVQVGNEFDVDVVLAKKEKEAGVNEFQEVKCIFSPSVVKYFYIPKGSIQEGEKILIVDDLIRTGTTQEALIKLVEKSKARVIGIFTIVSIGDSKEKLRRKVGTKCPIKSIVNF
jgi:adenine phosphoribosyltransferase